MRWPRTNRIRRLIHRWQELRHYINAYQGREGDNMKLSGHFFSLLLITCHTASADPYTLLSPADKKMAASQETPALTARGGFKSFYEWVCFDEETLADSM